MLILENAWKQFAHNDVTIQKQQAFFTQQDLSGKKVLIIDHAGAGIGDVFFYIRYAQTLNNRGATVFLEVRECIKKS